MTVSNVKSTKMKKIFSILILHLLVDSSRGVTCKKLSYQTLVSNCLDDIIKNQFKATRTALVTILVGNLESPSGEILDKILIKLQTSSPLFIYATITGDLDVEDYNENISQKFDTEFYLIVLDDDCRVEDVLGNIKMTQTFNPYAICLIYLETDAENKEDRVRDILDMFFRARFRSTAVLVHENQSLFNLFTFNFTSFVKETCEAPNTLNLVDRCVRGKMLNNSKTYFEKIHITDFSNCSLNIVTKPYPPFVINDKRGFEIDLLKIIGENLNVRFRINVHEDENWRESTNNTREGLINYVLEKKYLGIGNIGIGNILDNELEFSYSYHLEPIVFVVPIARDIPRWRILTVIFTTQMWGICIATIVVFGCGFCLNKKHENYNNPFLTSFQISITQPVHVFPKNDINRILFAALSVLSIMLTSAYTCTLIKDLKNPMKEHQISKNKEILQLSETLRYKFGGESIYKQLFDKEIIETNYQTMSGVNDTTKYWIKEVAEKKILWTLSSAHYVRYLIAINSDVTNKGDDQPKVYVAKFHFSSYPLSIVARKGHFMLNSINEVVKKMLVSGLVDFSWRKYERKILEEESRDSRIDTVPCEPLSIQHLQGAFVVLVFGYIFGVLMLVVEVFIKKIKLHNKIVGIRKSIIKKILKKNK